MLSPRVPCKTIFVVVKQRIILWMYFSSWRFRQLQSRDFLCYQGDYAVLVGSGLTHQQAILCNILSATTAVIGFFVGASVSANETTRQWIFAVTIGMFLYISLVDLVGSTAWSFIYLSTSITYFSLPSYQLYYLMVRLRSNASFL